MLYLTPFFIARSSIVAPFSGVVAERYVAIGESVDPHQSLVQLLDESRLSVRVDLSVSVAQSVLPEQKAFWLDEQGARMPLTVISMFPNPDSHARRYTLRAEGAVPDILGSVIPVLVPTAKYSQAYKIPNDYLLTKGGQYQLAVLDEEKRVRFLDVASPHHASGYSIVDATEFPTQLTLINEGANFLAEGDEVVVLNQ